MRFQRIVSQPFASLKVRIRLWTRLFRTLEEIYPFSLNSFYEFSKIYRERSWKFIKLSVAVYNSVFAILNFYQEESGVGLPGLTAQSHVEVVGKDEQALVFYPVQDRDYDESFVLGNIIKWNIVPTECVQASGVGQPGLTAQLHVEVVGKDEQEPVFYPVQDRDYNESGVLGMIIK